MEKILELLMSKPELIMPVLKEYIEKYKPMAYSMAQEVVEVYKDYSNNTDYPAVVAKTKRNMFDAYVGAGFTEDQALALMINDNIQLMKNIKQVSSRSSRVSNKSVTI